MDLHKEGLAFKGQWFQEELNILKDFIVTFYPFDSALEMYDIEQKKAFLRRTPCPGMTIKDFFVGAILNVFGRQIHILDYADGITAQKMEKRREKVFLLILSKGIQLLGRILDAFLKSGYLINHAIMIQANETLAKNLFGKRAAGNVEITMIINEMINFPCAGFELNGSEAIPKLNAIIEKNNMSKYFIHEKLIDLINDEYMKELMYFSKAEEHAKSEIETFFDPFINNYNTAILNNSTLAVIKPHALKEGKAGEIINDITQKFKITAIKMIFMERGNCEEFYEIYRNVLSEYIGMVFQLASGVCLALELQTKDPSLDVHHEFRTICGPMDVETAKQLRPQTLRAKYGRDKIANAVHCTDLAEDSILELEYFFKILE